MTTGGTTTVRRTGTKGVGFRTTHWSVVLASGRPGQPEALAALERLCGTYWYPLYAYVRRRGYRPEEAQDLTQEFFARLLAHNLAGSADPARGRFRSFLLTSLSNFLNNQWDRAHTAKRGAGSGIISWDAQAAEARYRHEPFHEDTPEKVFERRWALTVMAEALTAVRQEYARAGKAELFESLQGCLPGGDPALSHAQLAIHLKLSEGAVKVAAHRLRRRFVAELRRVIAHTLGHEDDIDEELRHLVSALG